MKTLIRGGTVIDGTGGAARTCDVLLSGGRIEAVSPRLPAQADEIIDASGLLVCPGFIDMHRHCDAAALRDADFGLIELSQGITTTVAGNCGIACVPIPEKEWPSYSAFCEPVLGDTRGFLFPDYGTYFSALGKTPLPLNLGVMAATGAVKVAAKGFSDTPYSPDELAAAQSHVQDAMDRGALGVTLGFMYQPECYTTPAEQAAVIAPAARAGRLLTTHIRGEGDSLTQSVEEVISIAREAGIRLQVSHFKATGIRNWGKKIGEAMERIEKARAQGQPVAADFYPYAGGSTTIFSLIPPDVARQTNGETLAYLSTAEGREAFRASVSRAHEGWDNMALSIGWDRIHIASVHRPENAWMSGKSAFEISEKLGYCDPALFAADLAVAEDGLVGIIVMSMDPADVDAVARLPYTILISDALYGGGANPHPRLYGAFPRFLRDFVFERRVLPLEAAVRKMTSMPAEALGLSAKGRIAPGMDADLCLIDPDRLRDRATYEDSRRLCEGVARVIVGGKTAWKDENITAERAGRLCLAERKG